MSLSQRLVVASLKGITNLLCRIDAAELGRVPERGPLILVTNHVNILEIPIIFTQLQPRPVTGLVLATRWDNPVTRWLLEVCGAIPLRRGEADVAAMRRAMGALGSNHILAISPEGTRSGHGRLQQGQPGAVLLALRSEAPLLPVVYYGSEDYKRNVRRLRRTDFHIRVGRPFRLNAGGIKISRQVRHQMIDEVMYQMAALLPAAYRGIYHDMNAATKRFLDFT